MAGLIESDREPSATELRWFGVLFLGFWSIVAGLVGLRAGRPTLAIVLASAAALLTLLYYGLPTLRRPLLRAWLTATHPIAWLGSHVALGVFYFLVMTPLALAMRAFGRDALQRRLERERPSYWVRHRSSAGARSYWNQY